MTNIKRFGEDILLWIVFVAFCAAMFIDYMAGTKLSEWLI